ncbi:hypothetical protein APR50_08155 [Variovorax paradoxus]|nr:hypothetical protein APR52_21495 [Variovorax paradoxus]KPV09806.1 hypothetical protein APR50_08155 [Variovorax paradoxus]KPV12600.1 hypothetical protein APR49_06790 [Variovorax paradoxus]KPV22159.1 hypothetical protein APR51_11280 [Variovorax paradoxus]KPV34496.1 hypothetical protein APR48_07100 [Variovorax paradoxus]
MSAAKVLIIATFPIIEPRHGGQLRTRHIYEAYRKAGIEVDYVGFFPEGSYPRHATTDIVLPGTLGGRPLEECEHVVYDHLWGLHIATTRQARDALLRVLRSKPYDFIQIDHLYLWPLVRACLAELGPQEHRPRIVHSAHNIEHAMKRQILAQSGATEALVAQHGEDILALEREITLEAEIVFAVTAADQAYLNELGQREDAVLAPNGTSPPDASPDAIETWKRALPREPFAVFVSSAHPPNAVGFFSVFSQSLAFLPPDRKLVIAGGVTSLLEKHREYRRWAGINDDRTLRLGIVDDAGIAALRRLGHVYILPITAGGGSNIKTAEALLTGAYVIGTSTAFRGFEDFIGDPGVFVEDDPHAFRARLFELLHRERLAIGEAELNHRRRLLWESTLAPMPTHLLATFARHAHA